MPASEAQINANKANAAKSTGPKTTEGKERSRQNSLKHGFTGAGIVLSEADAAEVERRTSAFAEELMAIGEVGQALARLAALHSVRIERGADQQTAALTARIRRVEADFVAPTGVDDEVAAKLRAEAVRIAMLDPSPEAVLARRYEAASERGFYKAIKELRQIERENAALLLADDEAHQTPRMGSFGPMHQAPEMTEDEYRAVYAQLNIPWPGESRKSAQTAQASNSFDVPMTIGRPR